MDGRFCEHHTKKFYREQLRSLVTHCLLTLRDSPTYPEYKVSMTCFEHGSCSSGPRRRVGPSTGLSNHEHFMNWKDRKDILKKEQLPELDSKHCRQLPLTKTQLQERSVVNPTCERILEKECGCLLVRYVVSNTWSSRTEVDCWVAKNCAE